ncbi:CaiB/BaiF CoA-transferase family protein [Nocardioides sp. QY071]|uniref:CaiB/BaiF CoA transferase family protein n=1 Tax=Nocardioides sp. QY071 TaxID=3044187 RepID=UPI00249C944A|nr:CaiB/BaiF CoA-transferase family protein [Nocardioides sp. QY071]WGY00453.1 CaiB/BaiF CoA-transferase family protein [Nocardioides sp. QY071]
MPSPLPLSGIRVLDFSTLVPGPLASLLLSDAGADVLKVERPGVGDEMRVLDPLDFVNLNRGKRSVALDLKDPSAITALEGLIERADVLIEQFRPGVMDRLGLGYEHARALNPRILYCSITGYGQDGPLAAKAGHDLNYLVDAGLLASARRSTTDGVPHLPPTFVADIGGGSYPAVVNILLGLRSVEQTGVGAHLDIAMTENLFLWHWWVRTQVDTAGSASAPGTSHPAGGSPRYSLYPAADGAVVAVAALEERFWQQFCELLDLPAELRRNDAEVATVEAHLARLFAQHDGEHWHSLFDGRDVCVSVMTTPENAFAHPHWLARGTFNETSTASGRSFAAIPSPLHRQFRRGGEQFSPQLGSSQALFEQTQAFFNPASEGDQP